MSMRSVAEKYGTNHKLISRILKDSDVEKHVVIRTTNIRKYPNIRTAHYGNMASHLRWDISYKWLLQFEDFEKLKILNKCITKRGNRYCFTKSGYMIFIKHFYHDAQFNLVYSRWLKSDKEGIMRPSLDHIIPKSKGGKNKISNFQFLSWFENRVKNNMDLDEWNNVKKNIKRYFV
jgi:hypothetical protein